ncbi:unnamed protein product [Leuciscus chuanchicus]
MENGKAPGIDGIPVEFYKAFWPLIGEDLLAVLSDSLVGGLLPLSCRRAVLTLLPKKDPELKLMMGFSVVFIFALLQICTLCDGGNSEDLSNITDSSNHRHHLHPRGLSGRGSAEKEEDGSAKKEKDQNIFHFEHLNDIKGQDFQIDNCKEEKKVKPDKIKVIKRVTADNKNCKPAKHVVKFDQGSDISRAFLKSRTHTVGGAMEASASGTIFKLVQIGGKLSAKYDYSHQNSETTSKVDKDLHSVSMEIEIPPNHSCTIEIKRKTSTVEAQCSGQLTRQYKNGEERTTFITDIYDQEEVAELITSVKPCTPLPDRTTQATSREIESLSITVKQLVSDVGENKRELCRLQNEVKELRQGNIALKAALDESRRYGWKSFLKIHGLKEEDGENVRSKVIGVLKKVVPDAPVHLDAGVDIVHRLGPKTGKTRSIIIMFSLRRVRDAVWQAVRRCTFLKDNNLTITEPVPPEDRAAREKLWPLVKKAREEGKRASFKDSYALIDGKKFNYADV